VWEVRASPPRTNCPVTLVLQNEEPRAVSPLTKKNRNPKRRIDFKDEEQVKASTVDNNNNIGAASWADMVRNGHHRISQSSSGTSSPPLFQQNATESKENGAKKEIKERGSKETFRGGVYRNKKNNTGKDYKENSITDLSCKTSSTNSIYQSVMSTNETARHSTAETTQNSRKSSTNSEKNLSTETSLLDEDIAREHEDDEGWEVVSRGRGKPVRKGYNRVHTMVTAGSAEQSGVDYDKNLRMVEKRSEYVDLDDSDGKVDHDDDDQVDYDINEDDYWQTSVAMEISDSDGKYDGNRNNSADSSGIDEPIRTGVQVCYVCCVVCQVLYYSVKGSDVMYSICV